MNKVINFIIKHKYLLLILLIGGILRFTNLGYSDFQGDEIKALFLPESGQDTLEYLLDQRKGPVQFIITYTLRFFDPLYTNQLLMRIPFALAGFFSIYFFYRLVEESFDEKIAFYASFFFATNGFLVAFSRIVQYQSFVIMFMLAALYYLKHKKIYLGLICWAISILSHYDGLFIFPLAFYFIYQYLFENKKINIRSLKKFIAAGVISLGLLATFYIPFILSITSSTQEYWLGRITGEVSTKISSSMYLFSAYQPIYAIQTYLGLFTLGVILVGLYFLRDNKKLPKFLKINTLKLNFKYLLPVAIWTFLGILVMEILVYIPGTHIYTYLIPAMIFMGFGILLIEIFLTKYLSENFSNWVLKIGVFTVFLLISLQSYAIFVENNTEYPWEQEQFLFWTLPKPSAIYHLSMFGFPYYRDWENIEKVILGNPGQSAYSTNERKSIARRYIDLPKDTTEAGFFVHIKNPQSFTNEIIYEKAEYWANKYDPIYVFNRHGRDVVKIYIMEPGTLDEIQEKGL